MPQRKPYNPNTAYGRKKLREQAAQNRANMSPDDRANHDFNGCILYVIVIGIIALLIYLVAGSDGLAKWFSR